MSKPEKPRLYRALWKGKPLTIEEHDLAAFQLLAPGVIINEIIRSGVRAAGSAVGAAAARAAISATAKVIPGERQNPNEATWRKSIDQPQDDSAGIHKSNPGFVPNHIVERTRPKNQDYNLEIYEDDEGETMLTPTGIAVQTWCQIRGSQLGSVDNFPGQSSRYVLWTSLLDASGKNLAGFLEPRYGRQFNTDVITFIGNVMNDLDSMLQAGDINDPPNGRPWNNLILYTDLATTKGHVASFIQRPGGPAPRRTFRRFARRTFGFRNTTRRSARRRTTTRR